MFEMVQVAVTHAPLIEIQFRYLDIRNSLMIYEHDLRRYDISSEGICELTPDSKLRQIIMLML